MFISLLPASYLTAKVHNFASGFRERMFKDLTPFGHETRVCAGQPTAILILKMDLSTLVVPMGNVGHRTFSPRGMECKLIFTPRESSTNTFL
jgi:cytochrome P450